MFTKAVHTGESKYRFLLGAILTILSLLALLGVSTTRAQALAEPSTETYASNNVLMSISSTPTNLTPKEDPTTLSVNGQPITLPANNIVDQFLNRDSDRFATDVEHEHVDIDIALSAPLANLLGGNNEARTEDTNKVIDLSNLGANLGTVAKKATLPGALLLGTKALTLPIKVAAVTLPAVLAAPVALTVPVSLATQAATVALAAAPLAIAAVATPVAIAAPLALAAPVVGVLGLEALLAPVALSVPVVATAVNAFVLPAVVFAAVKAATLPLKLAAVPVALGVSGLIGARLATLPLRLAVGSLVALKLATLPIKLTAAALIGAKVKALALGAALAGAALFGAKLALLPVAALAALKGAVLLGALHAATLPLKLAALAILPIKLATLPLKLAALKLLPLAVLALLPLKLATLPLKLALLKAVLLLAPLKLALLAPLALLGLARHPLLKIFLLKKLADRLNPIHRLLTLPLRLLLANAALVALPIVLATAPFIAVSLLVPLHMIRRALHRLHRFHHRLIRALIPILLVRHALHPLRTLVKLDLQRRLLKNFLGRKTSLGQLLLYAKFVLDVYKYTVFIALITKNEALGTSPLGYILSAPILAAAYLIGLTENIKEHSDSSLMKHFRRVVTLVAIPVIPVLLPFILADYVLLILVQPGMFKMHKAHKVLSDAVSEGKNLTTPEIIDEAFSHGLFGKETKSVGRIIFEKFIWDADRWKDLLPGLKLITGKNDNGDFVSVILSATEIAEKIVEVVGDSIKAATEAAKITADAVETSTEVLGNVAATTANNVSAAKNIASAATDVATAFVPTTSTLSNLGLLSKLKDSFDLEKLMSVVNVLKKLANVAKLAAIV